MTERRDDGGTALENAYQGYTVYDRDGDKIGKVDELFVDENDRIEYMGVKMGLLGLGGTALVPWEAVRVDEGQDRIEVSADKETVKNGPSYDNEDITPDLEQRVHSHYGLTQSEGERGGYGSYYGDGDGEEQQSAERQSAEHQSGERQSGERQGEDELRVQRSEEELRAGTREREAGKVNVRKRVRTEREQINVPTRREEVSVDRVPVEGRQAAENEIGEDEVSIPVTEEEVVTSKDAVVKEEIRINKDVVQEEQVVEDEVRKEEVEIDDDTEHRGGERRDR